ncbi:MAG TPA: TIR domain-containing protein [Anaerolineales bacterium]
MAKLFVSYSRKDSVAAHRLIEVFKSIQQDVWVDWESIPPAVDWLEQIFRGIEESDAFIFLISPDSIASEVCKVEINRAAQNNKRIIPIVLRDVQPKDSPENIRKLNWTFIRENDNFEEGLAKVKTAIELDLDWLEEHRRLQVRSLEWHRKKDPSLLLRGRDLRNARHMVATATAKDPIPTDLQKTFIEYSLRSERNRTITLLATGFAVIALAVLSLLATQARDQAVLARNDAQVQRNRAEAKSTEAIGYANLAATNAEDARANEQIARTQEAIARESEQIAEAQRSAARAQIFQSRPGELYTSTLLAIDSMRRNPSDEAEEILRTNVSLLPLPVDQVSQAGQINAIAFNPDDNSSNTFVTASADGTTCAWRIESKEVKQLFCTLPGLPSVNTAAFSPDGSYIAMGDESGLVQILDPKNGDVLHAYRRVPQTSGRILLVDTKNESSQNDALAQIPVRTISIEPRSGQQVAVAYNDGQIPVFNPNNGRISAPLSIGGRPNVLGFTPNGRWLVAGSSSEGGRVSVWDLSSGDDPFSLSDHRDGVLAIAFSSKENRVVTGGNDNSAAMISLGSKKLLFRVLNQNSVRALAFSPDGSWFVTASDDHRIRIWDTLTGNERLGMSQDGIVTSMVVSPNGQWIATSGQDRTARVWNVATGAEIFQISLKAAGSVLAFSNDGSYLVSTDQSGAIGVWDMSVMAVPQVSLRFSGIVDHVQYSPSGERIAVSAGNRLWLLTPDQESGLKESKPGDSTFTFKSDITNLIFSPDSKVLGILTEGRQAAICSVANCKPKVTEASSVQSIAFSPDNQRFITSALDGTVQAWDVSNAKMIENPSEEYPQAFSLATSSRYLALGSEDKINFVGVDGDGGIPPVEAPGKDALLVFNEDGSLLASANPAGRIDIWKVQNGQFTPLSSFIKEQAVSLAFNPEGTRLAVGTAKNVFLMDVSSGKEVARIPHTDIVNGVSYSQDGKYLATVSSKVLQLWETAKLRRIEIKGESKELISAACSRLFENLSRPQWETFFGSEEYQPLCENLPEPQE